MHITDTENKQLILLSDSECIRANDFSILDDSFFVWHGRLVLEDFTDDSRTEIGTWRVKYIDAISHFNEGNDLFDLFDVEQELSDYHHAIFDEDGESYRPKIEKFLNYSGWNPNLLILDRLSIYSKFRGHEYGLLALSALIRRYGLGAGIIGMRPYPLQFEKPKTPKAREYELGYEENPRKLQLNQLSRDLAASKQALSDYYSKLGFAYVEPDSEFMFRSPGILKVDHGQ